MCKMCKAIVQTLKRAMKREDAKLGSRHTLSWPFFPVYRVLLLYKVVNMSALFGNVL